MGLFFICCRKDKRYGKGEAVGKSGKGERNCVGRDAVCDSAFLFNKGNTAGGSGIQGVAGVHRSSMDTVFAAAYTGHFSVVPAVEKLCKDTAGCRLYGGDGGDPVWLYAVSYVCRCIHMGIGAFAWA